jgi:hypothetical protein
LFSTEKKIEEEEEEELKRIIYFNPHMLCKYMKALAS